MPPKHRAKARPARPTCLPFVDPPLSSLGVLNLSFSHKMRVARLPFKVIVWLGVNVHQEQSLAGWQIE